jgi:hypothetical protein
MTEFKTKFPITAWRLARVSRTLGDRALTFQVIGDNVGFFSIRQIQIMQGWQSCQQYERNGVSGYSQVTVYETPQRGIARAPYGDITVLR